MVSPPFDWGPIAANSSDGPARKKRADDKHQKEKRSMEHFAGLDVSVKETSVCIVDDTGKIVREVKWRASLQRCWRC